MSQGLGKDKRLICLFKQSKHFFNLFDLLFNFSKKQIMIFANILFIIEYLMYSTNLF